MHAKTSLFRFHVDEAARFVKRHAPEDFTSPKGEGNEAGRFVYDKKRLA